MADRKLTSSPPGTDRRTGRRSRPAERRVRSTAGERRTVLIGVATRHFAERGYYGTPTLAIADEAGISQAYLFRLFPTKQDLFAACVESCIEKTRDAFERGAASQLPTETPLEAMGRAYVDLLDREPEVLLVQLHANAATAREPKVREAMREGWSVLFGTVDRLSGAADDEIRRLFAQGMLINVSAAAGFDEIDEPWARVLGHSGKGMEAR